MSRCAFETKQPQIQICQLPDGKKDVLICLDEAEEIVLTEGTQEGASQTVYTYDCHSFRTSLDVTEEEIAADMEYWATYSPAEEYLIPYKNKIIDEYTMQLIEEGVL